MVIARTESSVTSLCSLLNSRGRKKILFNKIDDLVIDRVVGLAHISPKQFNDQLLDCFRLQELKKDWLDEKNHDYGVTEKSLVPVCVTFQPRN